MDQNKNTTIENINAEIAVFDYVDAVFAIPENAVEIVISVKLYENGRVISTEGTYDLKAIREAINLFQQTCEGEYPKYVITEEGKKWLEQTVTITC